MTATAARAELKIARGFTLPLDLVTEATAIVATRGAGKSSASAVIVEEAYAAQVQAVVFDRTGVYWGLRSNAKGDGPGLPIYVLGGPHADVPLEPHAGLLIADLVVDSGHSFVLDLSDFSKAAAVRFASDFLERFYDRKARSRTTTLLVMDEAHFYAPQTPRGGFKGDSARLMGAMEDVVGLGRSRGIGVVLTTQRTQSLNKAVLDLIETLLVMRMLSPRARQAVREWIQEKHEDDDLGVIASLDSLPTGTAWVWAPLRGILEKVALRRIRTFDSYATPKPGETRAEPTARKELDLAALGEQMAATAERAKENDPAELRRRLREAEASLQSVQDDQRVAELAGALTEAQEALTRALEEQVVAPQFTAEQLEEIRQFAAAAIDLAPVAERVLGYVLAAPAPTVPLAGGLVQPEPTPPPARRPERRPVAPPPAAANGDSVDGGAVLNRRAERMVLAVLAQHPQGRTVRQVAILSGYASKGGGFRGALSRLRTLGYIEGTGDLRITAAGLAAIDGQYEPLPTGRALLDYWLGQMKRAAERAVLQAVYDAYPDRIAVEEVARVTGYEAGGGGFRGAVSKLRTLELIEGRGDLRIDEALAP